MPNCWRLSESRIGFQFRQINQPPTMLPLPVPAAPGPTLPDSSHVNNLTYTSCRLFFHCHTVVNHHQQGAHHSNTCKYIPHHRRIRLHVSRAQPVRYWPRAKGSECYGKKSKAHKGSYLAFRRQAAYVLVKARRLHRFAYRPDGDSNDGGRKCGKSTYYGPRHRGDK